MKQANFAQADGIRREARRARQRGVTLVELMVSLAIGSFLVIGAVQIYSQSRGTYIINERVTRIQENAQFAMDMIEPDLYMAGNWGNVNQADLVEGRAFGGVADPLAVGAPAACGADWVTDLFRPIEGLNNVVNWPCVGAPVANSDALLVRRGSTAQTPPQAGRIQVVSSRTNGQLFSDGLVPALFGGGGADVHDLLVHGYYVSQTSDIFPNVPSLRRLTLTSTGGGPVIQDQEVIPGVENFQVRFGLDMDLDNTIDRYVDPDDPVIDPASVAYNEDARIMAARLWLLVRSVEREPDMDDNTNYQLADVNLGQFNDDFRRLLVTKTILLRNIRT